MTAPDPGARDALPAPRWPVERRPVDGTSSPPVEVAWAPVTMVLVDAGPEPRAPRRGTRFGGSARLGAAWSWLLRLASRSRAGRTVGAESLTDRQLADVGLMRADLIDHRGWRR